MSLEDAEDAAHEAMLRAAERPDLDDERLGAWLTTVTMRLCVDRYRQVNREAEVGSRPTLVAPGPAPGRGGGDASADGGHASATQGGQALAVGAGVYRELYAKRDGLCRQVDGDVVSQHGHGEVGQFLPGLHDIEGAADARAGLAEDGKTLSDPLAAGDIHDHGAHPKCLAARVLQAEERDRIRVLPASIRRRPSLELVARRGAASQHLPHHHLKRLGFETGLHIRHATPEPPVMRHSVEVLAGAFGGALLVQHTGLGWPLLASTFGTAAAVLAVPRGPSAG